MMYYDEIWFAVVEDGEEPRYYSTKAAVTRWLRTHEVKEKEPGYPTQHVELYDHHPEEGGVLITVMPAPLWMQFIAGKSFAKY